MPLEAPFVGLAFRRGVWSSFDDEVVMQATGGPYVHSEFILGKNLNDMRCYTACSSPNRDKTQDGFLPTRHWRSLPPAQEWEVVGFPLNEGIQGYKRAYAFILHLLSTQIQYNYRDLWQCCVRVMLPIEQDVNSMDPSDWKRNGVFCSQACLLLLRQFSSWDLITLPKPMHALIHTINSRGCSPNRLYTIVKTGKKNTHCIESIRGNRSLSCQVAGYRCQSSVRK